MSFIEINLFGVYVAPISIMLVAAAVLTLVLRRATARFGVLNHVWHPALFVLGVFVIILSAITLVIGG
jgi:protein AaeX